MILRGARVLNDSFVFEILDIEIENGKIKKLAHKIECGDQELVIDCEGFLIIPGFVDVHIHGCAGFDVCDSSRQSLEGIAGFLITKGVTSFCPTTMTTDKETITDAICAVRDAINNPVEGARIIGVNLEGPFISAEKKGAHKAESIIAPDFELFKEWNEISGNNIKLVDIAPELKGSESFIKAAKDVCTVSLAHSTAGYDMARQAVKWGATHVTHLYNAMTGFAHREPGMVGAVFDSNKMYAEIICDGHHVHPSVLKTTFKLMADRLVIVSDSMRANGVVQDKPFDLGGQDVTVKDGMATLPDGTLAGSVTNLHEEVKNLVSYGVPVEIAVRAASLNPARSIGMDNEIGSIKEGKKADLLVLDEKLDIAAVYHW